ncbi:peptidase inhibitor family I36 protein [Micromonospora pisi]|uniref:peptidase inhibitor family I36 protein n=1 Tax=Micromonospora pisi TaxID=589240 RepID=UPI001B877258|nr:peptidase inhibitor family I36 protein [Micromonospora pisi]
MRKLVAVLGLMSLLVIGAAAPAQAASSAERAYAAAVGECPVGDFCVWSGSDATGSICNWANADADWYSAPVVCSWADNQVVRSAMNRGQSTSYRSVFFYSGANYTGTYGCLAQNGGFMNDIRETLRSHRWRTNAC